MSKWNLHSYDILHSSDTLYPFDSSDKPDNFDNTRFDTLDNFDTLDSSGKPGTDSSLKVHSYSSVRYPLNSPSE